MFNTSTRLKVYKSNKKKGACPLVGSTGYLSYCTPLQLTSEKRGYFFTQIDSKITFVGASLRVVFTKYDRTLDKADRTETKNVLNLVPLVTEENKDIILSDYDNLFDKAMLNYKKHTVEATNSNIAICTILPDRCTNLLSLFSFDKQEYYGWLTSLIKNIAFIEHIRSLLFQSNKYDANIGGHKDALKHLCNMAEAVALREQHIKNITQPDINFMYFAIKEVEPLIYLNKTKPCIVDELDFVTGKRDYELASYLVNFMFIDHVMNELSMLGNSSSLIDSVHSTRKLLRLDHHAA